jgi:ABC-type dipeptide/oligopeptide/nickel transport system ATPase component
MNQLEHLQRALGVSCLFISHDLAIVAYISHRIAVMYLGQIVELADSVELCAKPLHPYTQALFATALPSHSDQRHEKLTIEGRCRARSIRYRVAGSTRGARMPCRNAHAMRRSAKK